MSSLFAPYEPRGDRSEHSLRVVVLAPAAIADMGGEIRGLLEADAEPGYEVTEADAESAAARIGATQAGAPVVVVLAQQRGPRSRGDALAILAAWASQGLLARCVVVVVADGRDARRAVMRAGALACVDRRALDRASLIRALEDGADRFAAGGAGVGALAQRIEARMGIYPALFKALEHQPAIASGLYELAELAYLDSPIPALLKERLYTYLSRFCPVPHCLMLHTGILLGRGFMAGDSRVAACAVESVRQLLEEPPPSAEALARSLKALEHVEAPVEQWPEWDSDHGYHLRIACAQVFLHSHGAARWLFGLQRLLGPSRHEQLMLFLAFIRTGHFWSEIHPEIEPEPELQELLQADPGLAASLAAANHKTAAQVGASGRVQAELSELRQRVDHGQQLRELADAIPAFVAYVDAQRRYVFVNHNYVEHFARPAKDMVGRQVAEVLGEANYERVQAKLDAALAGEAVRFEASLTLAGATRELDNSYLPDRRGDGSIAGCFILATDVTERSQAECLTRRVLDKLFTFVTILAVDGTLIEANATPLLTAGITIDDVRGKKFWDCSWWAHSPDVQVQLREACERAAQGETVREDVPVRISPTTIMTMDFQVAPIIDGEGRVTHLIPSAVDITNRARAKQQLRESEERSRLAQRVGQVGIWEYDSATETTFWSESMWDIYGFKPGRGVDPEQLFRARLHHDDVARVQAWVAAMLAGEEPRREVYRIVRADHVVRWVEATATITRVAGGKARMVGVNIDITERKQAERVLRESEERLRMAKDAANLGIHDHDIRAGTFHCGQRVRDLWEVGPDEPIDHETFIAAIHPDDRAAVEAAIAQAVDPYGTGMYLLEYRVRGRVSGAVRWAAATGQTSFEDGVAVRLVGTIQDITARKQAEAALRKSQAQLREAARRKDEFLAMLGHELRNPLAAIRSASELLQIFASEDRRLGRVHEVLERQSNHMVRLIDGLLEVSRIARGKILLECKAVELREVLSGVLHDRNDQIVGSGLTLETRIPDTPVWVWGDDVRLAQIFDNLIGNAMKFTAAPGALRVTLLVEGEAAVVQVSDTGVGIHADMLRSIFDAFQQGNQGMARRAGGLGLGLALVKGLVELHDGSVEARSEGLGAGAQLEVRLPLGREPP